MLTCLQYVMGDFNLHKLISTSESPMTARIFFLMFMLGFVLVLVNMFLSIIVASYNREVRRMKELIENNDGTDVDAVSAFLKRSVKWLGSKLNFMQRLSMVAKLRSRYFYPTPFCPGKCWTSTVYTTKIRQSR